jgi:Adenylate kinase and related kinases
MRIQILGFSGSGKSTLARILAAHYNAPCLHLDNVNFEEGNWKERPREVQQADVRRFLEENPAWVIDGNYPSIAPERFEMADMVIYLAYGRFYCLRKAFGRYLHGRGKCRTSCHCPEKFDAAFFKWILWEERTPERIKRKMDNFERCKGEKHIFKNVRALHRWMDARGIELQL